MFMWSIGPLKSSPTVDARPRQVYGSRGEHLFNFKAEGVQGVGQALNVSGAPIAAYMIQEFPKMGLSFKGGCSYRCSYGCRYGSRVRQGYL